MYSSTIKPKADVLFRDLKKRVGVLVSESSTSQEALAKVTRLVSSELSTRSRSILSDMLFDLTDALMDTDFFKDDIARQNRFTEANLRQEILNKYKFTPSKSVNFKEASREMQAITAGGTTLVVGGAVEIGVVLASGLPLSSLVPIPVSVLIVASIGVVAADYYAAGPKRSRKKLTEALEQYLTEAENQFLNWFDEVEKYFNIRTEEIKKTM